MAVLLLLFMPFLTVSCSSPMGGELGVDYSGWDSTLGTDPSTRGFEGLSGDADSPDTLTEAQESRFSSIVGIALGVGFFGVIFGGAALLLLLGSSMARSVAAAGIATVAAMMLTANHLALRSFVNESLAESARQESEVDITPFVNVETRAGLVVTLTYLILFAVANVAKPAYSMYLAKAGGAPHPHGGAPFGNGSPPPTTAPPPTAAPPAGPVPPTASPAPPADADERRHGQ